MRENCKLLVDGPRNRPETFLKAQIEVFEILGLQRFNTAVFCAFAGATSSHLQNRWKTDLVARTVFET